MGLEGVGLVLTEWCLNRVEGERHGKKCHALAQMHENPRFYTAGQIILIIIINCGVYCANS